MPYVKEPAGSVRHPVGKVDSQLGVDDAPILASVCPFSGNVRHGQVEHFQQAVVRWENELGLGHFPQLAIKALDSIGGIDQPPDFLGKFEVGAQIRPVVPSGVGNLGIFLVPARSKDLQRVQGGVFIHCGVYSHLPSFIKLFRYTFCRAALCCFINDSLYNVLCEFCHDSALISAAVCKFSSLTLMIIPSFLLPLYI